MRALATARERDVTRNAKRWQPTAATRGDEVRASRALPVDAASTSDGSKSFHGMSGPSVCASQFGVLTERGAPAPRDRSWNVPVPAAVGLDGTKRSPPATKGTLPSTGSGVLRSVFPSRFPSKAKNALTVLLVGQSVAVHTLAPSILRSSVCPGRSPQSSLY